MNGIFLILITFFTNIQSVSIFVILKSTSVNAKESKQIIIESLT